jgi:hypothetical protein
MAQNIEKMNKEAKEYLRKIDEYTNIVRTLKAQNREKDLEYKQLGLLEEELRVKVATSLIQTYS